MFVPPFWPASELGPVMGISLCFSLFLCLLPHLFFILSFQNHCMFTLVSTQDSRVTEKRKSNMSHFKNVILHTFGGETSQRVLGFRDHQCFPSWVRGRARCRAQRTPVISKVLDRGKMCSAGLTLVQFLQTPVLSPQLQTVGISTATRN